MTHVGDDGFAALRPLGGWDPHVLLGQRVEVLTRAGRIPGVVAARKQKVKRGADRKVLDHDDLVLDLGARDGEEARSLVRVGDAFVAAGPPLELRNGRVASRSFDNRIGCYVALEVARRVAEAGGGARRRARTRRRAGGGRRLRGRPHDRVRARAGGRDRRRRDARDRRPRRRPGRRRRGEARRRPVADARARRCIPGSSSSCPRRPRRRASPARSRSRAGTRTPTPTPFYLSRRGIATGLVSVPLRYMHSPAEVAELEDIEAAIRLLVAFARRLEPGTTFARG